VAQASVKRAVRRSFGRILDRLRVHRDTGSKAAARSGREHDEAGDAIIVVTDG